MSSIIVPARVLCTAFRRTADPTHPPQQQALFTAADTVIVPLFSTLIPPELP